VPFNYQSLWSSWDPWGFVPAEYNLGVALTRAQVQHGLGERPALIWENAAGDNRTLTYGQLDALSSRFASSLAHRGIGRGDRVFLRLPNVPEFYVAALAIAKLGAIFIPSSTQFLRLQTRCLDADFGNGWSDHRRVSSRLLLYV